MEEIKKLCDIANEECKKLYLNFMENIITPFSKYRLYLQAEHIRDKSWDNLIELFQKKIGFDFGYYSIKFEEVTQNQESIIENFDELEKIIDSIKDKNGLFFIRISFVTHVNAHIILHENNNKYVRIYEPHKNEYGYVISYKKFYTKKDYDIKDLPEVILKQNKLQVCYMYILHFFLVTYFSYKNKKASYKYIPDYISGASFACDDLYIMNFTRSMIKLLHEYKYINDINYYLLTNNTYKMSEYLENNKQQKIDNIYGLISGMEMYNIIKNRLENIKMHDFAIGTEESSNIKDLYLKIYEELKKGNVKIDMNSTDKLNNTGLINSIMKKNEDFSILLIKDGIDVDKYNGVYTALVASIINNMKNVAEMIINKTNDINKICKSGDTALHFTVRFHNNDTLKMLLNNKDININIKGYLGDTALHIAVEKNYEDTVKILLTKTIDVDIKNDNGETAIAIANKNNNKTILSLLSNTKRGGHYNKYLKYKKKYLRIKYLKEPST